MSGPAWERLLTVHFTEEAQRRAARMTLEEIYWLCHAPAGAEGDDAHARLTGEEWERLLLIREWIFQHLLPGIEAALGAGEVVS